MKYYIASIDERNGDLEYGDTILFKTTGNPDRKHEKIAKNWRGDLGTYDKYHGGYWSGGTLVSTGRCREVPKEDYDVLLKYLTEL